MTSPVGELLPCPFCGQRPIKNETFSRRNVDCFVHPQDVNGVDYGFCPAGDVRIFSNDPDRIALWNSRAPPPPSTEGRERLTAFADQLDTGGVFISGLMIGYPDSISYNSAAASLINDLRALLGSQP